MRRAGGQPAQTANQDSGRHGVIGRTARHPSRLTRERRLSASEASALNSIGKSLAGALLGGRPH